MDAAVDVAIAAMTFFMMVAVGHSLTMTDLRRSATDLRALVTASLGQLVVLPAAATFIVLVLEPSPLVVAGLVLVAASPGGTLSNFYSCLAGANAALSITLTAISCLFSFLTIPALVSAGFLFWLNDQPDISVPVATLVVQLVLLVVVPTGLGMALRTWRPELTTLRDLVLRRISLVALVALVIYVVQDQYAALVVELPELVIASVIFTALGMAGGYCLAWATGRPPADRLTYVIEFPCRNLALATMVAIATLHRPDIVVFAAVLLLVQAVVFLALTLVVGSRRTHA